MKILLISRSDLRGGAAVFTYRLMVGLRRIGVDARMLVLEKRSANPFVGTYAISLLDKFCFLAERAEIFLQNGFTRQTLFQVDTAHYGRDLSQHPWVIEADVVMLNWFNQGALSMKSVERILASGKLTLFTLHDMWPLTGICHHAYDCKGYEQRCGKCPLLKSSSPTDLSHSVWTEKQRLYQVPNLHFVAVSQWLKSKCQNSSLLAHHNVTVIPNAVNQLDLPDTSSLALNTTLNTIKAQRQNNCKIIVLAAARIDDPVKGFHLLTDALAQLKDANLHLLLIGNLKNPACLEQVPVNYTYVGPIAPAEVFQILQHSDVVISSSHYESFGGTLVEGMLAGCVPVSFNNGGQTDIITHLQTGYLAQYPSTADLARGIQWAMYSAPAKQHLKTEAQNRFSEESVANAYVALIESLL